MARRSGLELEGWGDDFSDEKGFSDYPESADIVNVDVPDAVKEAYAEEDKVIFLSAAGMGLALLAGYSIKRVLKKRKA